MSRNPLPLFLLVLALAAPRPAWAQIQALVPPPPPSVGSDRDYPSGGTGSLITDILPANDPMAAEVFLMSPELQADLKARAPDGYEPVYARAAELKDMHDIIFSPRDAAEIRLAFIVRPDCQFCQRSKSMWAWIDKYEPNLWKERRKDMHEVYWDWEQLKPEQLAWLMGRGTSGTAWDALDLSHRREKLDGWAKDESAAIMALNPKSQKEADAMSDRIGGVFAVQGPEGASPLWDRLSQVRTGLAGMDRVKAMLGKSDDPVVKKAYQDALNAATPEARLAALSCIYDGRTLDLSAVRALAPAGTGQAFDARSRQLVAGLLASGLMNETDGTYAGKELSDFFATHPMKIDIAPTKLPALAWYDAGVLHFNEEHIAEYVKSQGRTLDDLGKDHALLQPLLREIVPIFVHEATHQRQDVFAVANGIPFYNGEAAEKEAMMTEALFILQKEKNDASYAAFLAAGQDRSTNIREELLLARRLQKDRADWFGQSVMATHYPESLSMTGQVWCRILWHNNIAPPLAAELKRRAALAADDQARLASGRDFAAGDLADAKSFQAALPTVGSAFLKDLYDRQQRAFANAPDAYAVYVKRLKDATALTDARLDALSATRMARDAVPAPTGWRKD